MSLARRLLVGGAGFALSAAPAYAAFYPPLREQIVGEGTPILLATAAVWVLTGGGITLYHLQEDPGGPGRWTLRYLLLLLFFASGFFLIKVNWAVPTGGLFAGMTGLGDLAGWGLWSLLGGPAGWILWGALSGAGLGLGLALSHQVMARSEPRNRLQEELEARRREEEDGGSR
ncbi:MAG: hypothetical protein R6W82_07275 [bacterium]